MTCKTEQTKSTALISLYLTVLRINQLYIYQFSQLSVFIQIFKMPTISLFLFLTVAALCSLPPFPSAAAGETDLAIQVCKNTTDFTFCHDAVYSDPHTPGADRYQLIDTIFRQAYLNASDTRKYIGEEIKLGGGGLEKCLANYNGSVKVLESMLNDLNSESYYELDIRSLEVERNVRACIKGLRLRGRSPLALAQRNQIMLKFANMCYVVSLLFEYH